MKLDQFLKFIGIVQTGGEAKMIIRSGKISVRQKILVVQTIHPRRQRLQRDDVPGCGRSHRRVLRTAFGSVAQLRPHVVARKELGFGSRPCDRVSVPTRGRLSLRRSISIGIVLIALIECGAGRFKPGYGIPHGQLFDPVQIYLAHVLNGDWLLVT